MADPSAPRKAPRSVVFDDPGWAGLRAVAEKHNTSAASLLRRAAVLLVHDQATTERDAITRGTSPTLHHAISQERCLVCRVMDTPDPVPPKTDTLRQNQTGATS